MKRFTLTRINNWPFPYLIILYLIFIDSSVNFGQVIEINIPTNSFSEIFSLPPQIKEASGLVITNNKNFWTHNDGGVPVLFCLDSTGSITKTLHFNHRNNGWEDLAYINGSLYIASIGNNKNIRKDLRILKILYPDTITQPIITAEVIKFKYENQTEFPPLQKDFNFDADALLAIDQNLYIFTKNRTKPYTGYTNIYKLPNHAGDHNAILVDSLFMGKGPMFDYWITGADISPDQSMIALLGHQCVWILKDFKIDSFSSSRVYKLNLNHFSHKAGIAFSSNSTLYIVDERELGLPGGKVYRLDLNPIIPQLK